MLPILRRVLPLLAIGSLAFAGTPRSGDAESHGPIQLHVDASDVTRGIFRVNESISVNRPGRLVLLYPKWLPGYHAPAGPIEKLGGLTVSAQGKPLSWRRDPGDAYAFQIEVPRGIRSIDLQFQYLSAVTPQQGRVVTTPEMLALEWHTVVLYPRGTPSDRIDVASSVKLPTEWRFATSLVAAQTADEIVRFRPVTLRELIDSPLYAGRALHRFDLDPGRSQVHLNVLADRPAQIAMPEDRLSQHRKLVEQADKLFGARPFDRYEFLVTLSDRLGGYGLEHRRSSENSISARYLLDWEQSVDAERTLLPHEYVHSWNGKFRLAKGLHTVDYHTPVGDTMLWLYEGLTEYWGFVLAARAGLRSQQQTLDSLATLAAAAEHRAGRSWRNLADTLYDPIIGRNAPLPWPNWQRGGDYYPEGPLLWLDIDTRIRELSNGARSLDDFARRFFGMAAAGSEPQVYDFDAVVTALNAVQPYDWASLLTAHLTGHNAPLGGIERGGWRLVYRDTQSAFGAALEAKAGGPDLSYSLGFAVGSGALLVNVQWGSPAFEAGLTIGTQLVAVDNVPYQADELKRAVATATAGRPLSLLVLHADRYREIQMQYQGGLRYPHLERTDTSHDRLGKILAPLP